MSRNSIWSRLPLQQVPKTSTHRPFRWVVTAIWPIMSIILIAVLVLLPTSLNESSRIAIFIFSVAVILWAGTSFNGAYVALVATLSMVLTGVTPQEHFFTALASDVIWLMIGAFILGTAITTTGLAARLTSLVVNRASTVRGVFWLLTTVLIPMALVIPSTSGRAGVAIPLFHSIAAAADDQRISRALAILIPSIILVSTSCGLIAAGSHLVAIDLLNQISGMTISYFSWLLYGLPFGVAASYMTTWVIQYLFLNKKVLDQPLASSKQIKLRMSFSEKVTLCILLFMVGMWLTEHWHGIEIATTTIVGALLLTLPKKLGVLKWKNALAAVSWNLILFVGAATVMGKTLIDTGAAQWIIGNLFAASGILVNNDPLLILMVISLISLTSHVYMTSHTARAAALVPPLLFMASSQNLNPVAVLFISIVGMNYCLTFPVSSKALLMFYELETTTYQPHDLLKLSAVLFALHLVLIILFYFGYWQWVGLAL